MGQVLDIVPNHMSIGQRKPLVDGNAPKWMIFSSRKIFRYQLGAGREKLRNKLLIPVLEDQYGAVLDNRGIEIEF